MVLCNLVRDSKYNSVNKTIYTITPNTSFGSLITERPPALAWYPLNDGTHKQMIFDLIDQNANPVFQQDPTNTTITVLIRDSLKP